MEVAGPCDVSCPLLQLEWAFVFFAASVERGSYFPGDNLARAPVLLLK